MFCENKEQHFQKVTMKVHRIQRKPPKTSELLAVRIDGTEEQINAISEMWPDLFIYSTSYWWVGSQSNEPTMFATIIANCLGCSGTLGEFEVSTGDWIITNGSDFYMCPDEEFNRLFAILPN